MPSTSHISRTLIMNNEIQVLPTIYGLFNIRSPYMYQLYKYQSTCIFLTYIL